MKKLVFVLLVLLGIVGWVYAQDALPPAGEADPADDSPEEAAEEAADEPLEETNLVVIFAIDASASVEWTDPTGFRKAAAKAILELTQSRGGDWVAVVQFAGWKETSDKGWDVFDLKQIQEAAEGRVERELYRAEVKNAINEKLGSFGRATDFNFAFEKAIQSVLDQREVIRKVKRIENKVWIILISDGSMEVVEGNEVRQAYVNKVNELSLPLNRGNLNAAATQIFSEQVLPKIAASEDIYLSCISIGEPNELFARIGELDNAQLLSTAAPTTQEEAAPLKTVLVAAFAGLPQEYGDYGITRAFDYWKSVAQPMGTAGKEFHIYQGTSTTHLLLLATASDFEIDIENQADISIVKNPGVTIAGKKDSYRLVSISDEPFGDYRLRITNNAPQPAAFEFIQYAEFDLLPDMGTTGLREEYEPGEKLEFIVKLMDKNKSAIISDPALIKEAQVLLEVTDVDDNVTEEVLPFVDETLAQTIARYQIPDDAPGGQYRMKVQVGVIKDTVSGRYAYLSEPEIVSFSVLSPLVELSFAQNEALIGQPVEVAGVPTKGSLTEKQKSQPVKAAVVHTESHAEKEIVLTWVEESTQLRGSVTLDELNEWRLKRIPLGTGQLKPVDPTWIIIKPRGIRVYETNEKGERVPVDKICFKRKLEQYPPLNLVVETDVVAGEVAELSVVPKDVMEKADVAVTLSGEAVTTTQLTAEGPGVPLGLTLNLKGESWKEEMGELVITAKFPATSAERKIPITIEVPPKPFPWLYLAIAGAAALLVLFVLLFIVGGPRFEQQQLHIIGGQGHLLKEWQVGRRSALGTVEVPKTVHFRLKGSKSQPRCMVAPGKNATVFVKNIEVAGWTQVNHGEYVEIRPERDEYSYRYRYFERAPTEEELRVAEEVTQQIGEDVFLGEDEFILADDDDLGAASSEATQALVEQARLLKQQQAAVGPTEILVQGEQEVTEAIPSTPREEHTEVIDAGAFGESEDIEATQAIEPEGKIVFTEMGEAGVSAKGPLDLPFADDAVEPEPTQAIGTGEGFGEMAGEPTQAIMSEAFEPGEEMGEEVESIEELAELAQERLEMSEFVEEDLAPPLEEEVVEDDFDLAGELDKTFDQILGEEEKEDEI